MCVLETDSEIGVEKISLANDSVTKSLDLICLAMFHTRLLRIRSHLLCNVNLCLVITLKSFQAYVSLAFSCRRNQLEVHLDQMLISSYYLSTAFSIDPAIKYFGSLVLFLCVTYFKRVFLDSLDVKIQLMCYFMSLKRILGVLI